MKSIADRLPPEIARQMHPDRRENEAAYWTVRDQLLDQYHGQWIGCAAGRVVASGSSPVTVFHAAEATGTASVPLLAHEAERLLEYLSGSRALEQVGQWLAARQS